MNGADKKDRAFVDCMEAHNDYILELKGTNRLIDDYHATALPWVMDVSLHFHTISFHCQQPTSDGHYYYVTGNGDGAEGDVCSDQLGSTESGSSQRFPSEDA